MANLLKAIVLMVMLCPSMAAAQCTTYGDTSMEGTNLCGSFVTGFSINVTSPGIISNITVFTDTGNVRLALYADTGSNTPGLLLAQSNSTATTAGWNTVPLTSNVSVSSGTYWLYFQGSGACLYYGGGSIGDYSQTSQAYGPFPSDLTGNTNAGPLNISIYTSVCPAVTNTPTSTPTITPTPRFSPTPKAGFFNGGGTFANNRIPLNQAGAYDQNMKLVPVRIDQVGALFANKAPAPTLTPTPGSPTPTPASTPVTIGYSDWPNGGSGGVVATKNYLNQYAFPAGTVTDLYVWINTGPGTAAMNIWSDSGGNPNALLYCSSVQSVTSGAYAHFAGVNLVVTSGNYWIGSHSDVQRTFKNVSIPFAETAGAPVNDCSTVPGVSVQNDQFAQYAVIQP